jgi:hypothetical protein
MPTTLADWDKQFAQAISQTVRTRVKEHATLLPLVPERTAWEEFLASVGANWQNWEDQLSAWPSCLLMLYCGLAFYEYDENTFWPKFAKAAGAHSFPPNKQAEINNAFGAAAGRFGLKLKLRGNGTDFVGSAVDYVGVPLSLWDGFLEVCDWALWRKDWKQLSETEWAEAIEKRAGSRTRTPEPRLRWCRSSCGTPIHVSRSECIRT